MFHVPVIRHGHNHRDHCRKKATCLQREDVERKCAIEGQRVPEERVPGEQELAMVLGPSGARRARLDVVLGMVELRFGEVPQAAMREASRVATG